MRTPDKKAAATPSESRPHKRIYKKNLIIFLLVLAACEANHGADLIERQKAELGRYPRSVFQAAGLRARYSDSTHLDYSTQHGTQIEYMSSGGRAYLWYPGNTQLVVGEWNTQSDRQNGGEICFRYPSATFNPATRTFGGNWSCQRAADFIWAEEQYTKGDPYRLSTGQIPFVLPRDEELDFRSLQRKTGVAVQPHL